MHRQSKTHVLDIEGDGTTVRVLTVMPSRPTKRAVLLLHEKRGLDEHTTHVARRLAEEGFIAFCPDLLSRFGTGRSGSVPTARGIPTDWLVEDASAVAERVAEMYSLSSMGCLGFSFGGEVAARLALRTDLVSVLVAYYSHLSRTRWRELTIPTRAIFAGTADQMERVTELRDHGPGDEGPELEVHSLPGRRAFEDPHRPDRYDAQSARQAWGLTVEWFERHLTLSPEEPTANG